jgi:hypothetical protein
MNQEYICYCGLYCENCATKAKVEPAARTLYREMKAAGFEDVVPFLPGGEGFWAFLTGMAEQGACVSCRAGSGDPGCEIRICAKGKGVEMCAVCGEYPCERFAQMLAAYPNLRGDNALFRERGREAWAALQDSRRASGYTYADARAEAAPV